MPRVVTAIVLAVLVWLLIREAPPVLFFAIALPALLLACWECYNLLEMKGQRPFKWLGLAMGLAVGWSFMGVEPRWPTAAALFALLLLSLVRAMWSGAEPAEMLDSVVFTLFPVVFVALGLAHLLGLRRMPGEDGQDLLLLLFSCVILADTAAYYVGSAVGRHRLAPRLSPRKSWEGAAAGLVASLAGGLLAHGWFYRRLPLGHALALGLALGVAAILGDLAESMVKRAVGVKDASSLLPGHGGLLDRADSLLLASPVLYYYYRLFLQGSA